MARYQSMCKCSFNLASRLSQQWLRRTGDWTNKAKVGSQVGLRPCLIRSNFYLVLFPTLFLSKSSVWVEFEQILFRAEASEDETHSLTDHFFTFLCFLIFCFCETWGQSASCSCWRQWCINGPRPSQTHAARRPWGRQTTSRHRFAKSLIRSLLLCWS